MSIAQNAEWNRIKWNLSGGARAQARRIASGTRQRRFDLRESRPRLNGVSTHVTFIGRMRGTRGSAGVEENCERWFAGRLHNTILRHNDCNALMHFGTVHRAADWRCFESPFSRLPFATKRFSPCLLCFESHEQSAVHVWTIHTNLNVIR